MPRLDRSLHPGAWWLWAISMATAASRTTNPLLLLLLLAAVGLVVTARRGDAPWAQGLRAYLVGGLVVVAIRVVLRMLLDGTSGGTVLFRLPEVPLPDAAAGIRIGGPVTLESVLAAAYDGLRLATLLLCIGAANLLANPKRLLRTLPGALHEIGVAITVALTFAPQLVESGRRVRRAQRLRGGSSRRRHLVRSVGLPVLTDALDRSLRLAAAMDVRGYGRLEQVPARDRRWSGALLLVGVAGIGIGAYGLLDATVPRLLGGPLLGVGVLAAMGGLRAAGRRVRRTTYRPSPWRGDEWAVLGAGVGCALCLVVAGALSPAVLHPSVQPLSWPALDVLAVLGIVLGASPALLTPRPSEALA